MLRIKRRAGERVIVGDDVVIEVLEIRGASVRLGIAAPRSIPVYREEIWREIKRESAGPAPAGERPSRPGEPARAPDPARAARSPD